MATSAPTPAPPVRLPHPYADPSSLWYEDLHVGRTFVSRGYEVTQEAIVAFAREFDPQVFHLDPEAARTTFFAGLAASGWHTAAITMRLVAESLPLAWGVVGAGTEDLHWPKPTRAGFTLRVQTVVESARLLKSRPGLGMVVFRCNTLDQDDEVVQVLVPKLFVPVRQAASA